MKNLKYFIKPFFAFLSIVVFIGMFSCNDMMNEYKEYTVGGEINYPGKIDSVKILSGKERVLLTGVFISDPRITGCCIYWDGRSDSLIVPVARTTNVDTLKQYINVSEGVHSFEIYTFDENGNRSVPVYSNGTSLGAIYESGLFSREVSVIGTKAGVKFTLSEAGVTGATNVANSVTYTSTSGEQNTLTFPASENEFIIPDNGGEEFSFSSSFLPENAVDTLSSVSSDIKGPFLYNMREMAVIDFSSQHPGGNDASNVLLGTNTVRWHTLYGGPAYPHYVTIDMGVERTIVKAGVWTTIVDAASFPPYPCDTRGPDKIQLFASTDNVNWTDLGGVMDFNRFITSEQFYEFSPNKARYFKFVGVSGPEAFMVIGGINIYGY